MFLATDSFVAFDLLLFTNLDVALVAGSAASVINIIDAQIDINMARTSRQPIAQGRVSVKSGILFSAVTGIAGMSIIALLVDPLTAWLNPDPGLVTGSSTPFPKTRNSAEYCYWWVVRRSTTIVWLDSRH